MNIAQHVERAARWLPAHPAIIFEGAHIPYADLAALKIGAIAVSINATFKPAEVKYIVEDSGASMLMTTGDLLSNVPKSATGKILKRVLRAQP